MKEFWKTLTTLVDTLNSIAELALEKLEQEAIDEKKRRTEQE